MSRSGPVLLVAAATLAAACDYKFDVPPNAQISCRDGGAPCPDGWDCDATLGRCVVHGSVVEIPELRVSFTSPLATAESGGAAALAVALGATPTSPVRIPVVSTRPGEATAFPPELTFTASSWNQPQTVTVQGVRDSLLDGDQAYEIVLGPPITDDARYGGLAAVRIPGTNDDEDVARVITVPPAVTTSESDTQATPIQVYLSSRPSNVVVVPVGSSDTAEATVTPASVAFDAGNWSTPQIIRVIGVDDPAPVADGRRPYSIQLGPAASADTGFQGVQGSVAGQNDDNDSPGVRVDTGGSNLYVYERFGSSYFSVSLFTQPSADVSVTFTSLNPAEVTVEAPATVTFNSSNWQYPQYVNVAGVDDEYDDAQNETPWVIQSSNAVSADPNYGGFNVADVSGVTADDDVPGVLFDNYPYGSVSGPENAAPTTVKVSLAVRPRGPVTISPFSPSMGRVAVTPATITLDTSTWSAGAQLTITPVDNNVREGDQSVELTFSATAGAQDPGYQNLLVPSFWVYLQDEERIIYTLNQAQDGDMAVGFNPQYAEPDNLCGQDPTSWMELFGYPMAMVASPGPPESYYQRIASLTPGQGDGQSSWVLQAGRNYVRGTRNGPVIGRANARNLLDFPLQNALSTSTKYWTGLNQDWTTSASTCTTWNNNAAATLGQSGGGGTTAAAISSTAESCAGALLMLCVEQ